MKKIFGLILILLILFSLLLFQKQKDGLTIPSARVSKNYWFVLERKSGKEFLYLGEPGEKSKSALVKIFKVKSGIPNQRPTPLPKLLGQEYWLLTNKFETLDNPETAPYFLTLNIPVGESEPYGPSPYLECNGQCNWQLPGAFGLHGVNGDSEKIADTNPGSSGCIRHTNEDITYLYNLLDPQKQEIRYYIEDV
jgi:hypothetical protein